MPDHTYPVDAIGNPIKSGYLVKFELPPQSTPLWRVIEVTPARVAEGVTIPGSVTLQSVIPLTHNGQIPNLLCMREPESSIVLPRGLQ